MFGIVRAGAAVDTALGRYVPDAIHTHAFIVEDILPCSSSWMVGNTSSTTRANVRTASGTLSQRHPRGQR
jgi:hypothetical protein